MNMPVEAARGQGRTVEIVVTNEIPSIHKLLEEYPPGDYGYELTVRPSGAAAISVVLQF